MDTNIIIRDLIDTIDDRDGNTYLEVEIERFLSSIGIELIYEYTLRPYEYKGYILKNENGEIFRMRYRGQYKYLGDYAYQREVDELTLKDVIEKRMKKED